MHRVTVGPDGQLALPPAVLEQLGIRPGDVLLLSVARGGLLLMPTPRDYVDDTYGLAREMWVALGGSADFVRELEESWRA